MSLEVHDLEQIPFAFYNSLYMCVCACVRVCVRVRACVQMRMQQEGARGSVVVKALCYKPEGRGFETR
jgi:hypothetical protein